MFSKYKEMCMINNLRKLGWRVREQYSPPTLTMRYIFGEYIHEEGNDDRKTTGRPMRIDAMCTTEENVKVAFEYNGPYHYYCKKVKWKPTVNSLNRDWCKRLWLRAHDIHSVCVSPSAPTDSDYLRFRAKVCKLSASPPLKGNVRGSTVCARFIKALGDVPYYLTNLGMWSVYTLRDDAVCITCLVVYSIDPGQDLYREDTEICVERDVESRYRVFAFPVTAWLREKHFYDDFDSYSRKVAVENANGTTQYSAKGEDVKLLPVHIHVPYHRSSNSRYLTCRIVDEVDDASLFLLPDRDLLLEPRP